MTHDLPGAQDYFVGARREQRLQPGEMAARADHVSQEVYQRAHERGEIDLAKVPPAARITVIIDELFLPLLAVYRR